MSDDRNHDLQQNTKLTRRQFQRLIGLFGATVAYGVVSHAARAREPLVFNHLAERAEAAQKRELHAAAAAETTLKFGVSGHTPATHEVLRLGIYEFKEEVERRTNGAVHIELHGGNSICTELNCVQKTLTGTIQGYNSATQNAAHTVPFLNCLDFPYLFQSRAGMFHFFYDPRSEKLFRKPLREKFNIEFLWTHCELRNLFMGLAWRDKPRVRRPEDVKDAKIRVTGSDLGRIALDLFGTNPTPLDWAETLEGLKSGVVDGQETFTTAAAGYNMGPVTSQEVAVEFFAGTEHTAMDARLFASLDGETQKAIREAAYAMQQFTQRENELSLKETVGLQEPPKEGTIWDKEGVRVNLLSEEEKAEWFERASPEVNPKPYDRWREQITRLADSTDLYREFYNIAREIPDKTEAINVQPKRWWEA